MDYVELLGLSAGIITTSAWIPQVVRAFRTRSTKDLSFGLLGIVFIGAILWLIYGLLISSLPISLSNAAILILSGILLGLKLKYG
ncbi:MAG: SemiSWEET transporter [Candidatus Woesearchaeota archaeon]